MTAPIVPGAEPWSAGGTNGHGALVLHGFTGSPYSMRPLAEAFHRAGFAVEMPLLPGHGTSVADMIPTRWADYAAAAEAAYERLAARVGRVVVAGLSMGGTLAVWLGTRHADIAGLVCVNAAVVPQPAEMVDGLRAMVAAGDETMPSIGNDIARSGVDEHGYDATPLAPLLSLAAVFPALVADLGRIAMPVLICTSPQDHVVAPASSDALAAGVAGPVERVELASSYHVATLDHDAPLIEERATAFARRVCGLA